MTVRSYRDLIVWQKAMDLVVQIYGASRKLPREEIYGLTAQLRRSAVSIPPNIAEGQGRQTTRDFLHFLSIAHGSLCEVETRIILAVRLQYLDEKELGNLLSSTGEVGRLLNGLCNSLESKIANP